MSVEDLIRIPCVFVRRTAGAETNRYGDKKRGTVKTAGRCYFELAGSDEEEDTGQLAAEEFDFYFLAGTELRSGDAVEVAGSAYELIGNPTPATRPSGEVGHVEGRAKITRAAGDSPAGSGSGSGS